MGDWRSVVVRLGEMAWDAGKRRAGCGRMGRERFWGGIKHIRVVIQSMCVWSGGLVGCAGGWVGLQWPLISVWCSGFDGL